MCLRYFYIHNYSMHVHVVSTSDDLMVATEIDQL